MKKTKLLRGSFLLLSVLSATTMAWADATVIDAEHRFGFENSDFDGYYAITNADDFAWFADKVNNDHDNFQSANAVLVADIDLSSITNWTPIGTSESAPYKGKFDGQNHSITGMTMTYSTDCHALFGCTNGSTVQNFL